MAKKQEADFTEALKKAKELSTQAEAEAKEIEARMAKLDSEIAKMMAEQRQLALESAEAIKKSTVEQAKRIHEEIKHLARLEEDKVEGDLRRNMVEMVKVRLIAFVEGHENEEKRQKYLVAKIEDVKKMTTLSKARPG